MAALMISGSGAFAGLADIEFGSGLGITASAEVDSEVYKGFEYYLKTDDEGNVVGSVIKQYTNKNSFSGPLTIEPNLGGYPVIGIDKGAFSTFPALTNVKIPSTVTYIDTEAFSDCPRLYEIDLGDQPVLETIGTGAFRNCVALREFNIPAQVKTIGAEAFMNCTSLSSMSIGKSVETIGERAFKDCTALTIIIIPNNVLSIGNSVFEGCVRITNATIGDGLTNISEAAFKDCVALGGITIPNGIVTISKSAFENCTAMKRVVLGKSVKTIGDYAFKGCTGLMSADITEENNETISVLETIGVGSFQNCVALNSMYLSSTVRVVSKDAFNGCSALATLTLDGSEIIGEAAFMNCVALKDVVLPEGVVSLGKNAFKGCTGLTSIVLPDTIESIGEAAFYGDNGLSQVVLPAALTVLQKDTFKNCITLSKAILPDGLTAIEDSAFENCASLGAITLPESLTAIGSRAFADCTALENIRIPKAVDTLGAYAFSKDTALKRIYFAADSAVTVLPEGVFEGCTKFIGVDLPAALTTIEKNAFFGCKELLELDLSKCKVAIIGEYAFANCSSMLEVDLGSSIKEIDSYAFSDCSSLGYMEIPSSIELINDHAFSGCTGMQWLHIPSAGMTASSIGKDILAGCSEETYICSDRKLDINNKPVYVYTYAKNNNIPFRVCVGHTNAHKHEYSALESVTVKPTCTTDGKKTYYCIALGKDASGEYICAETLVEILPATGHSFGAWVTTVHPTYTSSGKQVRYCSAAGCGHMETVILPALHCPVPTQIFVDKNIELKCKDTKALAPTVRDENGNVIDTTAKLAPGSFRYSSSNDSVVTVDNNGKLTAVRRGTATVTTTYTSAVGETITMTTVVKVSYTVWQWIIIILLGGWFWYL
ncbi:MAG: leucine-rich repeat protein [Acutalibacteraceae bacterium]